MLQKSKNIYHLFTSHLAASYYRHPSKKMTVIGVTGTDGKSTIVNMIYHILKSTGKTVSMISSINATIGGKSYDTGFHVTTPSPLNIQKLLNKAQKTGSDFFVLEVTSHRLEQNSLSGVNFTVAVISNIGYEHLDYHKTWENYAKAKAKILKSSKFAILNRDDKSFAFLRSRFRGRILTFGNSKNANFNQGNTPIKIIIPGEFNQLNALAAVAASSVIGITKQDAIKALKTFNGIKGRMEEIIMGQDFKVVIDFAHTPSSLEAALITLNKMKSNVNSKLIAVFGSAGQRDKQKRKKMGKIASKLADFSILTAEDPRNEKTLDICTEIAKGFEKAKNFQIIEDRKDAIFKAIKKARQGDIVAFFGKSHEKSMAYGKKELPWDEFKIVKQALKKYG